MGKNDVMHQDQEQQPAEGEIVFYQGCQSTGILSEFNAFKDEKNAQGYTQNVHVLGVVRFAPMFQALDVVHIA